MRFIIPTILSLVVLTAAGEDYSCKGASKCPDVKVEDCNRAVNDVLIRNDDMNYGPPTADIPEEGVCSGSCKVVIRGNACTFSGNDIWNSYQKIRKSGCAKCGVESYKETGCEVAIDYAANCK